MPLRRPQPFASRQGFTLVELMIGMAVFAILALGVTGSALRSYKDAEDANRYLAAHALAVSVLQQAVPSKNYDEHLVATVAPANQPYTVLDSAGNNLVLINKADPVFTTMASTLEMGNRKPRAEYPVGVQIVVSEVENYACFDLRVICTYKSIATGNERQIEVSMLTPSNLLQL